MGLLDSLAGFIDNEGLAEAFAVKPDDPAKVRRPLLDGIQRTREQYAERTPGTAKAGGRWWQIQNGIVAFTVRLPGGALPLNGSATNHLPEAMFAVFLDKLEQAVEAGELDDALKAHQEDRARSQTASTPRRKERSGERHPGTDREDWDTLTWAQRQKVNALFREGRNPDGSVIAEVGYKPDAPL
ncbi:hypothetical protein [Sphingomonas sp. 8AM]|uniref:hypothetical protein n=1 Tax=Sphingomonas sp. 8AM TaxID=2653170 RepID=UPI0012F3F8D1|nr:hypothetical protein [Sphingomonas sp. 8AM]VXC74718.1 conserved hypothetical protein [Sphingomonas sp. 8AM]